MCSSLFCPSITSLVKADKPVSRGQMQNGRRPGQVFPSPAPPKRNPELGEEPRSCFRGWDASDREEAPRASSGRCSEGPPSLSPAGTRGRGRGARTGSTHFPGPRRIPAQHAEAANKRNVSRDLCDPQMRRSPEPGPGTGRRRPCPGAPGPPRAPPAPASQRCFCDAFCLGLNRLRKPTIWSHLRWLISSFSSKP